MNYILVLITSMFLRWSCKSISYFSMFVELTRNILCNQYNCYWCWFLDEIDTCSTDLYYCIYSFNILLSICTSIHKIIDTICFYLYSYSYLINNIAMDAYTFVTQSISQTWFIYMFLLIQYFCYGFVHRFAKISVCFILTCT